MPELLRQVASLPARTIIYYLSVTEDGDGNRGLPVDALDRLAAVANAPIYSWHTVGMNHGIVGGSLQSAEHHAEGLGAHALRVLRGERPEAIPVAAINLNVRQFDWRQLRRWRIDESRLPPGSEILNRQLGAWELYKPYILAGVLLLTLQAVLIVMLLLQRARRLQEIAERKRVEEALLENEAGLRASHQEIQHLAGRLIAAQENERARIARDLHDDISQQLAGLSIAPQQPEEPDRRWRPRRHSGRGDVAPAADDRPGGERQAPLARPASGRPSARRSGGGPVGTLRRPATPREDRADVQCATTISRSIDPDAALCLFRVAQEALRNVDQARRRPPRRGPSERGAGNDAELTIADDGRGFDAGSDAPAWPAASDWSASRNASGWPEEPSAS